MYAIRLVLVACLLQSCYRYSCEDPTVFESWEENIPLVLLNYSISTASGENRYTFRRGPVERFFVELTQLTDECRTYAELNRVVYNCIDCPYEFLIDHQAIDSAGAWGVRRILLSSDGLLLDSVSYSSRTAQFDTDSHSVRGFTYSEVRGLLIYENDSIRIAQ